MLVLTVSSGCEMNMLQAPNSGENSKLNVECYAIDEVKSSTKDERVTSKDACHKITVRDHFQSLSHKIKRTENQWLTFFFHLKRTYRKYLSTFSVNVQNNN